MAKVAAAAVKELMDAVQTPSRGPQASLLNATQELANTNHSLGESTIVMEREKNSDHRWRKRLHDPGGHCYS